MKKFFPRCFSSHNSLSSLLFSPDRRLRRRGFTVFELVVVLSIMIVISIVVFSSLSGRRDRVTLDNTTKQIAATLREAQSRSAAQESSVVWGVHFDNSAAVPFYALFKNYYSASNTVGYYPLPQNITYASSSVSSGGSVDVTFAQISGAPSTSTSITLYLGGSTTPSTTTGSVSRSGSGKIFFDDFNRTNL